MEEFGLFLASFWGCVFEGGCWCVLKERGMSNTKVTASKLEIPVVLIIYSQFSIMCANEVQQEDG